MFTTAEAVSKIAEKIMAKKRIQAITPVFQVFDMSPELRLVKIIITVLEVQLEILRYTPYRDVIT